MGKAFLSLLVLWLLSWWWWYLWNGYDGCESRSSLLMVIISFGSDSDSTEAKFLWPFAWLSLLMLILLVEGCCWGCWCCKLRDKLPSRLILYLLFSFPPVWDDDGSLAEPCHPLSLQDVTTFRGTEEPLLAAGEDDENCANPGPENEDGICEAVGESKMPKVTSVCAPNKIIATSLYAVYFNHTLQTRRRK